MYSSSYLMKKNQNLFATANAPTHSIPFWCSKLVIDITGGVFSFSQYSFRQYCQLRSFRNCPVTLTISAKWKTLHFCASVSPFVHRDNNNSCEILWDLLKNIFNIKSRYFCETSFCMCTCIRFLLLNRLSAILD